jgi:hypothetical protein
MEKQHTDTEQHLSLGSFVCCTSLYFELDKRPTSVRLPRFNNPEMKQSSMICNVEVERLDSVTLAYRK